MNRTLKTNGGDLQRLLPIQRALTEIQHDVKEAREAVESVVDSDSALNAVRWDPVRVMVHGMGRSLLGWHGRLLRASSTQAPLSLRRAAALAC